MKKVLKKMLQYMWIGILVIVVPCLIKARTPDPDTFFLAATGRYIVETGVVPTVNPFVIHDNFGIIVQQWLFDVLVYRIYDSFGNEGLFVFVTLTYTFAMVLLYKYFGLFTKNRLLKNIVLLVSGILYVGYAVVRPTCISFIILLLLLYCMERYRRTGKLIYMAVLPIL